MASVPPETPTTSDRGASDSAATRNTPTTLTPEERGAQEVERAQQEREADTRAAQDGTTVAINNASRDLAINLKHIQDLTDQIKFVTDCEVLTELAKSYLKQLTDLIAGIIKSKTSVSPFLAILAPPSPDPFSIVSWIKKLIGATAFSQLKATIDFIQQLILLAVAVKDLIQVLDGLKEKLEQCAIQIGEVAIDQVVDALAAEVEEAIFAGLEEAGILHARATEVCGINPDAPLDTSSPEAFEATLAAAMASLEFGLAQNLGNEASNRAAQETTTRTDQVQSNIDTINSESTAAPSGQ